MRSPVMELLNKMRAKQCSLSEVAAYLRAEQRDFSPDEVTAISNYLSTRFRDGQGVVPDWFVRATTTLLGDRKPKIVCDPWAGYGPVLAGACAPQTVQQSIAITRTEAEAEIGRILVPRAAWQVGEPLTLTSALPEDIDVVVSVPPFGLKPSMPLTVTAADGDRWVISDEVGRLLIVATAMKLSRAGIALFVVTPSFFFSATSIRTWFDRLGLSVQAAFSLVAGPAGVRSYLVVIKRGSVDRMFVAQLSANLETNEQILSNYRMGREGGMLSLGRFVEAKTFTTLEAVDARERSALAQESFDAPAIRLSDLAKRVNIGGAKDDFQFPELPNSIFIPLYSINDVYDSVDALEKKPRQYAQVVIDPEKSFASFVAKFLNSEHGREMRERNMVGTAGPRLNRYTLSELQIFVPPLSEQKEILRVEAMLTTEQTTIVGLQNEVADLRRMLWKTPKDIAKVEEQIIGLSTRLSGGLRQRAEQNLEQWFETIPFPLASILRAWQATPSQDYKTKTEHLLHFFEATAQ